MGSHMDSYSLKSVLDLPPPFCTLFSFRYFNSLQSECFSGCFLSDINMVISAPTGSGKTVLFDLCVLRLLSRFLSPEGKLIHSKGTLETVYIAPSKALVQEKLCDWNMKFNLLGIICLEMTGDNEYYRAKNIQEADIILTTPENFDSVTQCGIRDGDLSFFSDIALVLIDEVHLLNESRGVALEEIINRIEMFSRIPEMSCNPLAKVRFVAVSAPIPNIDDLAELLLVPSEGIKRFCEDMRPVKLTTKVYATTATEIPDEIAGIESQPAADALARQVEELLAADEGVKDDNKHQLEEQGENEITRQVEELLTPNEDAEDSDSQMEEQQGDADVEIQAIGSESPHSGNSLHSDCEGVYRRHQHSDEEDHTSDSAEEKSTDSTDNDQEGVVFPTSDSENKRTPSQILKYNQYMSRKMNKKLQKQHTASRRRSPPSGSSGSCCTSLESCQHHGSEETKANQDAVYFSDGLSPESSE